jgi:transposase
MVLFEKFGQHQPVNRQAERYANEGVPISRSTLADQVGGCTAALMPLFKRLEAYVLSAERLHGDDTRCPFWPKARPTSPDLSLREGRQAVWRARAAPGAVFYYSRDRGPASAPGQLNGHLPDRQGWRLCKLYEASCEPPPEAARWVYARRALFVIPNLTGSARRSGKRQPVISPMALEAARRIAEPPGIEPAINGEPFGCLNCDRCCPFAIEEN